MKALFTLIVLSLLLEMGLGIRDNRRNIEGDGKNPDTTIFSLIVGYDRTEFCVYNDEWRDPWNCGTGRGVLRPLAWNVLSSEGLQNAVLFWRSRYEWIVIACLNLLLMIVAYRKGLLN